MRSNFALASFTTFRSGLVALVLMPFGAGLAQEETAQLHTVLDIETLYEPVEPLPMHGETAVELLEEPCKQSDIFGLVKAPGPFDARQNARRQHELLLEVALEHRDRRPEDVRHHHG